MLTDATTEALELTLLGYCLCGEPSDVAQAAAVVQPEDFVESWHAGLWRAMLATQQAGEPLLPVFIRAHAERDSGWPAALQKEPGAFAKAMSTALDAVQSCHVGTSVAAPAAARHVAERSRLRKLARVGDVIKNAAGALERPSAELAAKGQADLLEVMRATREQDGPVVLRDLYNRPAESSWPGVPIPWTEPRQTLGLWRPKWLYLVAARPSIGKSALLINAAVFAATAQPAVPTLFLSMEMPGDQIRDRVQAIVTGCPIQTIMERGQNARATDAQLDVLSGMPLWIYPEGRMSLSRLQARVYSWRLAHPGPTLVCVDYLGLIDHHLFRRGREQEVAEISRTLKMVAMDCDVPMLVAAQLNRANVTRPTGKPADNGDGDPTEPRLHDLRDSGSQEQDADAVIFLHRKEDERGKSGLCRFVVAKQRQGGVGRHWLQFKAETTTFTDNDDEPAEAPRPDPTPDPRTAVFDA